jgi:hypothetical protein
MRACGFYDVMDWGKWLRECLFEDDSTPEKMTLEEWKRRWPGETDEGFQVRRTY